MAAAGFDADHARSKAVVTRQRHDGRRAAIVPVRALGLLTLALALPVVALPQAPASAQETVVNLVDPETARTTQRLQATIPPAKRTAPPAALRGEPSGPKLPQPLAASDAQLYRAIFQVQERGDWRAADQMVQKLRDRRLVGHVLAQRYLNHSYRSSWEELRAWLNQYADHPDSQAIYRIAIKKRPKGAAPPRHPEAQPMTGNGGEVMPRDQRVKIGPNSGGQARDARRIEQQVKRFLKQGAPGSAAGVLRSARAQQILTGVEIDHLWAEVAGGHFYAGADAEAHRMAAAAARRSGSQVPMANWYAGLAAWRLGNFAEAARAFEAVGRTEAAGAWTRAAGSYWASRAFLRIGKFERVTPMLRDAAEYPRTFYGRLAVRSLGMESPLNWELPPLTQESLATLARDGATTRAFALLQVGQSPRAEGELRTAYVRGSPEARSAILAIASRDRMPSLSMQLAWVAYRSEAQLHDVALYPLPAWKPKSGFTIDQALLFALIRQESRFTVGAVSRVGARGLMQVMPGTARQIASLADVQDTSRVAMQEPATNMALGQAYVEHLLQSGLIKDTLFHAVAGYNAGPGNVMRWDREERHRGDPLLFIEAISIAETRDFVERVLTNYWVYRERFGQPATSIDAVVAGEWPRYRALDAVSDAVAAR